MNPQLPTALRSALSSSSDSSGSGSGSGSGSDSDSDNDNDNNMITTTSGKRVQVQQQKVEQSSSSSSSSSSLSPLSATKDDNDDKPQKQTRPQQQGSATPSQKGSSSTSSTTTTTTTATPPPPPPPPLPKNKNNKKKKKKKKAYTIQQLELLNLFRQPIWIFDFIQERNRWTNQAGLEFWNADSLEDYRSRDRRQDRSASTYQKLLQVQSKIESGGSVSIQWTLYPKGVAKTVNITVTGIRLSDDEEDEHDNNDNNDNGEARKNEEKEDGDNSYNNEDNDNEDDGGHYCMLFHAVPVEKDTLEKESLRAIEMLRHLPMAVCQFDMSGKLMFQNQWAQLPEENENEEKSNEETKEEEKTTTKEIEKDNTKKQEPPSNNNNNSSSKTAPSLPEKTTTTTTKKATSAKEEGTSKEAPPKKDMSLESSSLSSDNKTTTSHETTTASTKTTNSTPTPTPTPTNTTKADDDRGKPPQSQQPTNRTTTTTTTNTTTNTTTKQQTTPPTPSPSDETATKSSSSDSTRQDHQDIHHDFLDRFINPKVAKEALHAIQTTKDQVIQLEAELKSTFSSATTRRRRRHRHSSSSSSSNNSTTTTTATTNSEWSYVSLRKTTDPVTGKPVILYNAQDKSDAKTAQRERENSRLKSEFLAIMAHEIRTPLHQVIGFVDLLDSSTTNPPLSDEQKGFVKLLQSSSQGLMTVISDVLDYSKLEAGQMKIESVPYEPLGVVEGCMAAVRTSCEEKQLTLTIDWGESFNHNHNNNHNTTKKLPLPRQRRRRRMIPFRLLGDPNRLRQILLNLLSNAIKFTNQGGIQVRASMMTTKDDEEQLQQYLPSSSSSLSKPPKQGIEVASAVTTKAPSATSTSTPTTDKSADYNTTTTNNHDGGPPPRRWIKFSVSDTGVGIREENQTLIFQKYQQENLTVARTHGGTGLGLSICQLLVQSMGGTIGVHSHLGQGSEFWFLLPVHEYHHHHINLHNDTIHVHPQQQEEEADNETATKAHGTKKPTLLGLSKNNNNSNSNKEETVSDTARPTKTTKTCNNNKHGVEEQHHHNANTTNGDASKQKEEKIVKTNMGLNVLVAEDNRVNQKLISNMLKRLGHRSTIAENGQIAIDLLEDCNCSSSNSSSNKNHDVNGNTALPQQQRFDVVLMDIQMPVMDGLEATRRLRTMGYTELPILGLTASVKQHDYRELGFDDWLAKPTPLKLLQEKLLRWNNKRGDKLPSTPIISVVSK